MLTGACIMPASDGRQLWLQLWVPRYCDVLSGLPLLAQQQAPAHRQGLGEVSAAFVLTQVNVCMSSFSQPGPFVCLMFSHAAFLREGAQHRKECSAFTDVKCSGDAQAAA